MVYLQEDLAEGHVFAPEEGEWVGLRPGTDLQGAAEPVAIYRALVKAIYSGVALVMFFLKLFFSFSFLALKICLPIDGVARIFILFILSLHSGNTRPRQSSFSDSIFTFHFRPERVNIHLTIANQPNYANGGNQTRATSTGSESAIHYSTASRLLYQT